MACPLPADEILRLIIELYQQDPSILDINKLGFLKTYIESLGGVTSEKKGKNQKKDEEPIIEEVEVEREEVESAESDVELDYDGVIEGDNDPPQTMGSNEKEVSEEDMEKSDEKKREAVDYYAEGKYEESIKLYTEAILLNPRVAVLYAKRGQCFLQLKKPNACIRDCSQALEINPDNAVAYKFRGRAHRLLGNFLKAAEDLRMACKIDFDEQADEWLKEVTPNARKIEDHQRKYERKRLEKDLKETKDRINKMKESLKKKANEAKGDSGGAGNAGPVDFNYLMELMTDPEVVAAFQDPEVMEAFTGTPQFPWSILKYKNNPNVKMIWEKVSGKLNEMIQQGFTPTDAGLREGAPASQGKADTTPPKTAADVDLD